MREIKSLTALRGLAALWVCVFHYTLDDGVPASIFAQIARSGFLGVVVFFVLSGFILSYVYKDWFRRLDIGGYGHFMSLRLVRVYPLHFLTLLIVATLIAVGVMPLAPNDNLFTFGLNLLLLQSWGFTKSVSWNSASWSISSELFCYLLFPVVLWVLHQTKQKLLWSLLMTATYWLAFSAYRAFAGWEISDFSYGVSLLNFVLIFMIGICAFHIAALIKETNTLLFSVTFVAGAAWMAYLGLSGDIDNARFASVLLIVGLSKDRGLGGTLLANPIGKFLGDISYALYLIHLPLVHVWTAVLTYFSGAIWFHMIPLSVRVGVAIMAAAALHYGFERPVRRSLRRALSRSPRRNSSVSLAGAHGEIGERN